MNRLAALRPLLLPSLLIVLALTAYNARISREMVDFEVYRTAGRRAVAAEPLYREGDGHYAFKYLPAFAVAMAPVAISTGWLNRCHASNSTKAAIPNRRTALAIAARISRRR